MIYININYKVSCLSYLVFLFGEENILRHYIQTIDINENLFIPFCVIERKVEILRHLCYDVT